MDEMTSLGPLIATDWLAHRLDDPAVRIIDGSWRLPGGGAAIDDYRRRHIPGAVFFDIDKIADRASPLLHMLPSQHDFETAVGALGISQKDYIVVYDDQGLFSAARIWWTFRAMGHENIAVLDGGLPKWRAENRTVTDGETTISAVSYTASPKPHLCKSADDIRLAINESAAQIFDARPSARFKGETPEPRPGLRSGAMPGAYNFPHTLLLNDDGTMRSANKIRTMFTEAGVDLGQPVITSCGSGITAAVLSLALELIGHPTHGLYDGSWAEWGDRKNDSGEFPVAAKESERKSR